MGTHRDQANVPQVTKNAITAVGQVTTPDAAASAFGKQEKELVDKANVQLRRIRLTMSPPLMVTSVQYSSTTSIDLHRVSSVVFRRVLIQNRLTSS
jgi:hypothetical protein